MIAEYAQKCLFLAFKKKLEFADYGPSWLLVYD